MYAFVRIVLIFLIFLCSIVLLKVFRVKVKAGIYALLIGISGVVFVALLFLPFENGFVTFESANSAFQYCTGNNSEIELVVEGEQCDFVVDRNGVKETCLIVPKTAEGWKIGLGSDTKLIQQSMEGGTHILVYQYKDTNDYFIVILNAGPDEAKFFADDDIEFYKLERYDSNLDENIISYYAYIPNFDMENRAGDDEGRFETT